MQKRISFPLYPTRINKPSSNLMAEIKTWQRVEKTLEWVALDGSFASETNEGRGGGGCKRRGQRLPPPPATNGWIYTLTLQMDIKWCKKQHIDTVLL